MLSGFRCPDCGHEHFGTGKFGQSALCVCGKRLPVEALDRARRHWLLQVAMPYGIATFLFAVALFHADLPPGRWEKFLSPELLPPSIASVIVVYRILLKHKKVSSNDGLIARYYIRGMLLFGLSFLVAILANWMDR